MDPVKRAQYEEETGKVKTDLLIPASGDLSREKLLECIRLMEVAKFEAQKKMYELVRRQRLPADAINQIIKIEEVKAGDQFFNDTGIEENMVEPGILRLNLQEDAEFKAIIKEFEVKSAEYLEAKKLETEEMVKKS